MVVADELLLKIRADSTQAQAALMGVDQQIDSTTSKGVGKFKKLGTAIGAAMAVAGAAVLGGGTKAFIGFDAAMTQSLAIMGDVSQAMRDDMAMAARDVAKTTTFSAEQAAEAYFFLASAGMDAVQSIDAMPQVAKFAQAGMFDMATATDLATDAQSALGLASEDPAENLANLTRVTDVFVRANTLANTSVEEIATAMVTKAGPAAKTLGMDIEETSAILAVMADSGVKGAKAGTQLSMTLTNMGSAARNNAGAWEEMGVAMFDADGMMRPMADIIEDMGGAMEGMSDEAKAAAIAQLGFGDKAAATIKLLLGSEEAMREYDEALRDSTGFVDEVAGKQLETFSAQWEILKSKMVDVGLSIGSVIVPKLVSLIENVTPIVDKIVDWIALNPELATQITMLGTAIGGALAAIGTGHPVIAGILLAITGIKVAMEHFGISIQDVMEFLAPFIEQIKKFADIIFGIFSDPDITSKGWVGALETLVVGFIEKFTEIRDFLTENSEEIKAIIQSAIDFVLQLWEDLWTAIEPLVTDIFNFISEEVGELVEWFQEIWPVLSETVMDVLGIIQRTWERIWPIIAKYIMPIWEGIKKIISGALDIIKGIIKFVLNLIQGNWGDAWDGIVQTLTGASDIIIGIVEIAWNALRMGIEALGAFMMSVWDTIWTFMKDGVKSAWEAILGFVSGGANSVLGIIEGFINHFIDGINDLIDKVNAVPGVNFDKIGRVNLPRVSLADGGMPTSQGAVRALVGERGPEIITMPQGSTVQPGGNTGPLIGQLYTQGKDGVEIAQEIGWELLKRGAGS